MRSMGLKMLDHRLGEYACLVRGGWLTPPTRPAHAPPPRKPVASFDQLMAELIEDREER